MTSGVSLFEKPALLCVASNSLLQVSEAYMAGEVEVSDIKLIMDVGVASLWMV